MPENPKVVLTFRLDTLDLDIDAPEVPIDFALSMIGRAKRMLENQEKILMAQQVGRAAVVGKMNQQRTEEVLSRIKLQ